MITWHVFPVRSNSVAVDQSQGTQAVIMLITVCSVVILTAEFFPMMDDMSYATMTVNGRTYPYQVRRIPS